MTVDSIFFFPIWTSDGSMTLANDFIFRFIQRWRGLICPDCFTLSLSRLFNERLVVFLILCKQKKK